MTSRFKSDILVSVLMTTFNSEKFVHQSVIPITLQSYSNLELIIVDDASTDSTYDIIKSLASSDSRIRVFKLKSNSGTGIARNFAISKSKGRFIAFCDSDDVWSVDKLKEQVKFMLSINAPISFTNYELIDSNGLSKGKIVRSVSRIGYNDYLKNTIIGLSTSMIDRSIVKNIKFENLRTRQDTLLWLNLFKSGHFAFGLDQNLVKYRVHSNSISSNKLLASRRVWDLYYNYQNLNFFSSVYYYFHYLFNAIKKRI